MRRALVGLAAAILLPLTLSGCAQSCQDKADHEWHDAQEEAINNASGPDDPALNRSIKDDFNDMMAYEVYKCGSTG